MLWRHWDTSSIDTNVEEFWMDVVGHGVLNVDLELLPQRLQFAGRLASRDARGTRFVAFRSGSHKLRRTSKQSRSTNDEHYMVGLQCRGISTIVQGEKTLVVKPGYIAVVHSGHSFEMAFSEAVERRLVLIPRHLLDRKLLTPLKNGNPVLIATSIGVGRILRDIIMHLTNDTQVWSDADCETSIDLLARLIASAMNGDRAASHRSNQIMTQLRLSDIEAATRMRLTEPKLSPTCIASELGISLRTLYRFFAKEKRTFSRFILEERLDLAQSALTHALDCRTNLMNLAMELGFNDAAHFSRSYRARFGETPRETRRRATDQRP